VSPFEQLIPAIPATFTGEAWPTTATALKMTSLTACGCEIMIGCELATSSAEQ
jgi:hypothetical protein